MGGGRKKQILSKIYSEKKKHKKENVDIHLLLPIEVTLDTFHFERSELNLEVSHPNMPSILDTRDTTHFETSPLNAEVF